MPPKQRRVVRKVSIKRLDFLKPVHVTYFKSLPVDEQRLYVGHYIDLADVVRFTQALLHFRPRFVNVERIKKYIEDRKPLDAVEFKPADYISQFSGRGESLLELAVRRDAEVFNSKSQTILKKVLDDIALLKNQGKAVTVIPQGVALGQTIVDHAGGDNPQTRRQDILNTLLTHPATRNFKSKILTTHHHWNGNLHRLNKYAVERHGNQSIAQLMRNLSLTKNTIPNTIFENVTFNNNAPRRNAPQATHNHNPYGMNIERDHGNWGERVFENTNRFSTPTQRVYTSQVDSGSLSSGSRASGSRVSANGSVNNVQQNVRLVHSLLNRANTLAKSETADVNSIQARRLHKTAGDHFMNIQNKLTNNTRETIKSKGRNVEARIAAKEIHFKTEGKKPKTNSQGPSRSNQSSQFRG